MKKVTTFQSSHCNLGTDVKGMNTEVKMRKTMAPAWQPVTLTDRHPGTSDKLWVKVK